MRIVERIILEGYVILYIAFQKITAYPFTILIEPSFPYISLGRIAIKLPTMTFKKGYGIIILIIFDFSIEYVTIKSQYIAPVTNEALIIIIHSLSSIFVMSEY